MKRLIPILMIGFLLVYVSSCEKDDICVEGDTPLLVLGFFDINDTTASKNVPALRVREIVLDTVLNSFADRTNLDSIGVPLRSGATSTSFVLFHNSRDEAETGAELGNGDTLTITYTVREAFISRACGFVAHYDDLEVDLPESADNWIRDISVVQQTIENSNNIHVKIFY